MFVRARETPAAGEWTITTRVRTAAIRSGR
jgi:hypothetical protein